MLRNQRALLGDVDIQGVEFGSSSHDVTGSLGCRILGIHETCRNLVDLSPRVIDHCARDGSDCRTVVIGRLPEKRQPLAGERVQPAQALLHAFEREQHPPRTIDSLGPLLSLELRDPYPQLIGSILQHKPLGVALMLGPHVICQLRTQADEFVGYQASLRVAHDSGDRGSFPGDLGLAAQRLELSAQLTGQIAQAREVRFHRLELAKRLLFAAPVLEDPRGFFDEPASVFGRGLQHCVEPTLPDDDVHLAPESRVAQELLYVKQTASFAVDRVLARSVAKQRPADRDLGVLDRQSSVAVVDRELHFGATQRPASRGTGENDVFHLAAAQGLGALLPHDPGQRIDDVGLARAVGSDDRGHPRFEGEGGRLGE